MGVLSNLLEKLTVSHFIGDIPRVFNNNFDVIDSSLSDIISLGTSDTTTGTSIKCQNAKINGTTTTGSLVVTTNVTFPDTIQISSQDGTTFSISFTDLKNLIDESKNSNILQNNKLS